MSPVCEKVIKFCRKLRMDAANFEDMKQLVGANVSVARIILKPKKM